MATPKAGNVKPRGRYKYGAVTRICFRKEFVQFFRSTIEPAPHSGDDTTAATELAVAGQDDITVSPLRFSNNARAVLSLLALRNQVNPIAPLRSKASDGIIGDVSASGVERAKFMMARRNARRSAALR